MEHDPKKNEHESEKKPLWLSLIYPIIAVLGFFGAGIGGMLYYLHLGANAPEYRMFVLQISIFVLILFFFFFMLLCTGVLASEAGKEERKYSNRYARFGIRCGTAVMMILLLVNAYAVLAAGGMFFKQGFGDYMASIQTEIDASKTVKRTALE